MTIHPAIFGLMIWGLPIFGNVGLMLYARQQVSRTMWCVLLFWPITIPITLLARSTKK